MPPARIAVIGDFNPTIIAHTAVNESFRLAASLYHGTLEPVWLGTETIVPGANLSTSDLSGVWCVPGSPYRSAEGALWAIQWARTRSLPFLGTCGGYQHALLEFARNELGLKGAEHGEENSDTPIPLVHRMACSLIDQQQEVFVTEQSFRPIYGGDSGMEGYHCSFGLNPAYEKLFAGSNLQIVARSVEGAARACRLRGHPFFVGTQFQPERRALNGVLHPVVHALFNSVVQRQSST